MKLNQLPVWQSSVSLGAKILYALTAADQTGMSRSLKEALEEALAPVQDRLSIYEAELAGAGF